MVAPPPSPVHSDAPAAADLLGWYDRHRRDLPWRARPGETADPYAVWLSEIMLQQTTVRAVKPYFERFLTLFPTVQALADAPTEAVMVAWAGLGYYSRARNLHACAKAVAMSHGGRFPETEDGLRALPGIGAYTAAAVAAIAFDRRAVVVDGNVERVITRLFVVDEPLPKAKPAIRALADRLTPETRPGDFAQALMDLGATICTPRKPSCVLCPWRPSCRGLALGIADTLPRKAEKAVRPHRTGIAFWLVDETGAVLLRRRAEKGLLGGMMEVPSTPWTAVLPGEAEAQSAAPVATSWRPLPGQVRHVFTHFELTLTIWAGHVRGRGDPKFGVWVMPDRFGEYALPSLMMKVVRHALGKSRA